MQPLTVLIGIVMGSAVSLAELVQERAPLAEAISIFSLISAASAISFHGELKLRHWRIAAQAATVALGGVVWLYSLR